MEAIGKSLTDEQVSKIKEFMSENGYENLWEARFELDQLLDIDIWDGELFHLSKAFDNGGMNFVIEDEEGKDVLKFDIKGENLHETNTDLQQYPFTSNFPDYHPHMTIAYLKPGSGKRYAKMLKGQEFDLIPQHAVYSKQKRLYFPRK